MSYDNLFLGSTTVPNHTQWRIKAENLLADCNIWTPTVDKRFPLGAIAEARDGRMWRYAKAAATEIAKASLTSAATPDAQQIDSLIQTAYGASAGVKKFDVLLTTANLLVADDLIDGWLLVGDGGTAMSDMYLIKNAKWTTSDTVLNVEIADAGGLRNAIAATDDIVVFANKCFETVVSPVDPVSSLVGATMTIIPASYYYWAQFRGYCAILCDDTDTLVAGDIVCSSEQVTGTVHLNDALTDDVPIGICIYISATDECTIVDMLIP